MKIEVNNDKILSLIFFNNSGNFEILLNNMIKYFLKLLLEKTGQIYIIILLQKKIIFIVFYKILHIDRLIRQIARKNILYYL